MSKTDIEQIELLLKYIKPEAVRTHLQAIAGERHRISAPDHLEKVREYIKRDFIRWLSKSDSNKFSTAETAGENLWSHIAGEAPEGTWLLTAHYDSVAGSPGADDNASAVAGMLCALRALSHFRYRDNIVFVAFDLEEASLAGSEAFVQQLNDWPLQPVKGVINLEMIGYTAEEENSQFFPPGMEQLFPQQIREVEQRGRKGDFITNVANAGSLSLMSKFEATAKELLPDLPVVSIAVPGNGEMAPVLRRSDHAPFWDAGIPALMLTDTSEFRNPNYHLSTDTLSTLNIDFITVVTKAATATIARLAGLRI
ncbi:MAG: M20/M25/M40 family metallo-hydrolase [Bacteroidia bacterium]